ncbi:ParB/Srx family N-terminal domain-containing protein [Caballeronia zhejiangensis]|nr:ParB/Srx family N-terminal domain-containing protein [Caballeronia zhejiangensis]
MCARRRSIEPFWPADRVERWPLDKLIPYAKNPRTHSEAQVAQIQASMQEWGFTVPILVSEDGTIIAGHGRVLAARNLGYESIPVMIARGWSKTQRRAYVIADNKLALNGHWDIELLSAELSDLALDGFEADVLGFSGDDLLHLTDEIDSLTPDGATRAVQVSDAKDAPSENGFRYSRQYGVIVICNDEAEQQTTYDALLQQGYQLKVVTV